MARSALLACALAATAYSVRVAERSLLHQNLTDAHESDFFPEGWLSTPRMYMNARPAVIPVMRVGGTPQLNAHGGASRLAMSPEMSMQDPDFLPELADNWKSLDADAAQNSDPTSILGNSPTVDPKSLGELPGVWKSLIADDQAQNLDPAFSKGFQLPRADWPEGTMKFHRFIKNDDPTSEEHSSWRVRVPPDASWRLQAPPGAGNTWRILDPYNKVLKFLSKTPMRFQGQRKDGSYEGSSRVMFTLPGEDEEPKTIEFLKSSENGDPLFGAVKVELPLQMEVDSRDSRLVVTSVAQPVSRFSGIRRGDIIRAVSVPAPDPNDTDTPRWTKWLKSVLQTKVPDGEECSVVSQICMGILDAMPVAAYDAALQQNVLVNGKTTEVVFLIERPGDPPLDPYGQWIRLPDESVFLPYDDSDSPLDSSDPSITTSQILPYEESVFLPFPIPDSQAYKLLSEESLSEGFKVLANFKVLWDSKEPEKIQRGVSELAARGTSLKLALTSKSFIEIYDEAIATRLKTYDKQFNWNFDSDWSINELTPSTMVAERVGTLSVSIGGAIPQMALSAIMKGGTFPESTASALENCEDCPSKLIVELRKNIADQWQIHDILVLKLM